MMETMGHGAGRDASGFIDAVPTLPTCSRRAEHTVRGHLLVRGNLTELGTLYGHRQHRHPGQHSSKQSLREGGIGSMDWPSATSQNT